MQLPSVTFWVVVEFVYEHVNALGQDFLESLAAIWRLIPALDKVNNYGSNQ